MKIIVNQIFWVSDDSDRVRNILFTSVKNKEMVQYLKNKGLDIEYNLYDFSPTKFIPYEDVIHIPTDKKFYKSWKINRVIEKCRDYDYIINIDADVFLLDDNYDYIYDILSNLNKTDNKFYVSNLLDLINPKEINFAKRIINKSNLKFYERYVNSLGPFYIVEVKKIFDIGGFDENFTVWGGEDDNMSERLVSYGLIKETLKSKPIHLPHKNNNYEVVNSDEYKEQIKILENKKEIIKNFIK
jgi:hypothetical protein